MVDVVGHLALSVLSDKPAAAVGVFKAKLRQTVYTLITWWNLRSGDGVMSAQPSIRCPDASWWEKTGCSVLEMEIHKDSGSAFNLTFHHLPCWKENHRGKECVSVPVFVHACVIYPVCADSVSVLILKVAPLSRDLSNADVHTSTSHLPPEAGIRLQPHGINKILFFFSNKTSAAPSHIPVCELSSLSRTSANVVHPRHTSGIDPSIFHEFRRLWSGLAL